MMWKITKNIGLCIAFTIVGVIIAPTVQPIFKQLLSKLKISQ